ncbi:hypothetical protein N9H39_02570 [Gammaproteobacteria bacterium]|nr:hypothetical protein [Gammaproteobacteria bacterium]
MNSNDGELEQTGTRFRLFPQPPFLLGFEQPETVWVSPHPGDIGPGPADDRMHVVAAIGKKIPYGTPVEPHGELYLPPWDGPIEAVAYPNAEGHFDHLEHGTPEFEAAHLYGTARFVLDIWEGYFGQTIPWHFRQFFDRMELLILPGLNNATMGYGFMEVGGYTVDTGEYRPFSLNFDIIAHEIGHSIVYEIVGLPAPDAEQGEYYGFHESAADWVAIISALHFNSLVDHIFENTRGNLYALNKLNRIGELSEYQQIRAAANVSTLSDFVDGWADEHKLAQPLTGAIFDIFIDIYHENLVDRGLIGRDVEELSDQLEGRPEYEQVMQSLFDEAFDQDPAGFREALIDTRDLVAVYMVWAWTRLSPDFLGYDDFARLLLLADEHLSGGRYLDTIRENFWYRDIWSVTAGPRLGKPTPASHSFSTRVVVPTVDLAPPISYYRRRKAASNRPL